MEDIKKECNLKSIAIYSDNEDYRYSLIKEWDNTKKRAVFIGTNPSKANELKFDVTIMNVLNFLIDHEYGSLEVVNLYAYISTNPNGLKNKDREYELENNKYIEKAISNTDEVIIGWERCEHKIRKREILTILEKMFKRNVLCFKDDKGKEVRHPSRGFNDKWNLVKYNPEKEGI